MSIYEILFLLTIPLQTMAVYLLNKVYFTERKVPAITEKVLYVIYSVAIATVFITVRMPIGFIAVNICGLFVISLCYSSKALRRIMNVLLIYFIMFISECVVMLLIGFLDVDIFGYSRFDSAIGILINRVVLVSVAYLFYKYSKGKKETVSMPWYYYAAHIVVIIGVISIFFFAIEYDSIGTSQFVLCCVIFVLVIAAILLIENMVYYTFSERHKMEFLKMQNEAYENQSEIISQSESNIRAVKHDINNHIYSIISMYESNSMEQAREYAKEVLDKLNSNSNVAKSGNFIIDSIVNFKLRELSMTDADISVNIKVPQNINIVPYDLTVILGNLLDNAVKAVSENESSKKLSLDISVSKGNLIVLIDNSYNGSLVVKDGILQSTKAKKEKHGMGISNVEKIAAKYGGEMYIDYNDKIFSVSVIIPYKE